MREFFRVNFKEEIPKYIQIANNIKRLIDRGIIKDGEKLPTIRAYTEFLEVNKITIVEAYKKLVHEGFAYQKVGSGTYAKRREVVFSFKKEYSNTFKKLQEKYIENIIDF